MNKLLKKYSINLHLLMLALCFMCTYAKAQEGLRLQSDGINYITNRGSLISSSYTPRNQFYIDYSNRLGLLSDVRSIYAEGLLGVNERHIIGAKFYSEQETNLFRKSRMGLTYGHTINLNKQLKWVLAADINAINIFFDASKNTAGGSAWTYNGNLSSSLHHDQFELAFAYHQIPIQTLTPINYSFRLKGFMIAYGLYKHAFSPDLKLTTGLRTIQQDAFQVYFDNHIIYQEQLGVLLSLTTTTYNAGFSYKKSGDKTAYTFLFHYQGVISNDAPGQNQVIIGILVQGK